MKHLFKTRLTLPPLTGATVRGGLGLLALLAGELRGQTGSAPVGVMSYAAAEYSTISLGVPLLRPAVLTGKVSAVTGAKVTLTLPAAGSVLPLVAGEAYFLEVIGNVDGVTTTLVGQRFEVDEAGTLAGGRGHRSDRMVLGGGSGESGAPALCGAAAPGAERGCGDYRPGDRRARRDDLPPPRLS